MYGVCTTVHCTEVDMVGPRWSIRSLPGCIMLTILLTVPLLPQATLKLGGGVGITSAVSMMNGSTMQYYDGTRYGLNSGLNVHAKGKFGLNGLDLVGEFDFSTLTNTGNSEPGQGEVHLNHSITSFKFGPEIHLDLPLLPLEPYLGLNISSNTFSGDTRFQGVAKVPSATYTIESATRIGIGMSLGAEVAIAPMVSLDFAAAYNFLNIYGKEWQDVHPGTDQRIDSYLSLNDAADPLYAAGDNIHFIRNDRSIHSMLFTVSILFGF